MGTCVHVYVCLHAQFLVKPYPLLGYECRVALMGMVNIQSLSEAISKPLPALDSSATRFIDWRKGLLV